MDNYEIHMAEALPYSKDEMYFLPGTSNWLNEFGYLYVGLYISGMICRYYPQYWIKEVSRSTQALILIDELVDTALQRAPLLLLGQLENAVVVYD